MENYLAASRELIELERERLEASIQVRYGKRSMSYFGPGSQRIDAYIDVCGQVLDELCAFIHDKHHELLKAAAISSRSDEWQSLSARELKRFNEFCKEGLAEKAIVGGRKEPLVLNYAQQGLEERFDVTLRRFEKQLRADSVLGALNHERSGGWFKRIAKWTGRSAKWIALTTLGAVIAAAVTVWITKKLHG